MSAGLLDNPDQRLICVDGNGKENGKTTDRRTAHTTPGIKHLAIQVLVFNSKKELILHERPLKKVGGGVLDAPTTHILVGESKEAAARRCLSSEYGISENVPIRVLEGYSYEKDYGDGSCENEFCIAAFATYDGKISPDGEHTGKILCAPAKKVASEIMEGSTKYPVWFARTIRLVESDPASRKLF